MEECLTTSRGKTHEKKFWAPKLGAKLVCFFFAFLRFASLVFLETAQDCSLDQCRVETASRAETSKKVFGPNKVLVGLNHGERRFFSILFIKKIVLS